MKKKLALIGGEPTFKYEDMPKELFHWPIITKEDEEAVLDVVRTNNFSGVDITMQLEKEFAEWQGRKHAIAYCNGTLSLAAAMFAIGLGVGDEIICPTKTYWASIVQAANFGASAVFCNINENLSMDPDDLERCIGPRTKAIMVVHYMGYPADMDRIMAIAKKYDLKVIEDVSHAHGNMYKGKKVGNFGDVAAMSMMSQKAFAAGELGMLVTDNQTYYERALAYAHYERNNEYFVQETEELKPFSNIALGGVKGRVNQVNSALALGQLKHYDERTKEINEAMEYFCDQIKDLPGIRPMAVDKESGSLMLRAYIPHAKYYPNELGGLSAGRFAEAYRAETGGAPCWEGGNYPLHSHRLFKDFNLMHTEKPTRIAFAERDVRELDDAVDASKQFMCVSLPSFKKFMPEYIDLFVEALKNIVENYEQLLENEEVKEDGGRWFGTENN